MLIMVNLHLCNQSLTNTFSFRLFLQTGLKLSKIVFSKDCLLFLETKFQVTTDEPEA